MSLLLISALAISGPVQPLCSWDRPGVNPFMGDLVASVDRYQDIPAAVRAKLKLRVAQRRYDELVTIKRDSIAGAYDYADLRDMHFGQGSVCQTVTRAKWTDQMQERGLVYCEDSHCLIVPTVCRNVSRITRVPHRQAQTREPAGPPESLSVPFAAGGAAPGELQFEAPAAGAEPSFASLAQDDPLGMPSPTPAPANGSAAPSAVPASVTMGPSHGAPRNDSWAGFAGYAMPAAPPVFAWADAPRSALQLTPSTPTTGAPAVPGIEPPAPTVAPPVIVQIPTVPPPTEPSPAPAGAPVVTVPTSTPPAAPAPAAPAAPSTEPVVPETALPLPNVPGVPEVPVVPLTPGVQGVPPQAPPETAPTGGGMDPGEAVVAAAPIPEPTTLFLLALGLALVLWTARRNGATLAAPAGAVSRE